jgi:hypothetical protein
VREPTEDRFDQLRDGRLTEEADSDRGHSDPELTGGEVLVDLVELFEHGRCASVPFAGQLLETRAARANQRELRSHEDAVDRDQDEQQDEKKSRHRR